MSTQALRLQVVFTALDKLTAPLKKITSESTTLGKAMKLTNEKLKELNARQKEIDSFRTLSAGLLEVNTKFAQAQERVKALAQQMKQMENPTKTMTRSFKAAEKAESKLKLKHDAHSQQLQELRTRLLGAGISTLDLAAAQVKLKQNITFTNAELTSQQKRLAFLSEQQQKVTRAQQHADKARAVAGKMSGAGISATVTGAAVGAPVVKGLQEAKHFQTEVGRVAALGLGKTVSDDAVTFAKNMQTYGTSQLDNLTLVRDGMTAFADLHHAEMVAPTLAKMKFGNHAFYGEESGADNERKFMDMLKVIELRGGLANQAMFETQANMVQKVITATGGRVGPTEWLNLIKTGGIAAKGTADTAFYYQMEPLVQEMGGHRVGTGMMSAYNNLYQGRTSKRAANNLAALGLIGDFSKVIPDKVGQTALLNPGALLGSELFKSSQFEWMEKVLLPQLAKKGITEKTKILDVIGSIYSNRTAGDLTASMYLQREQIHKNATLNAGAYGIDQINVLGKTTSHGKELEAQAKLADLKLAMGEKILPLYASGLEKVSSLLQGLNSFMQTNPLLAKGMIIGFSALAAILVILGPLMLALAALIGPYALLHVLFVKIGVAGGILLPLLRGTGHAFLWLGRILLLTGRALFLNPLGLAISAIALGVYAIYRNWTPITAFFTNLWEGAKRLFAAGIGGITLLIQNWTPFELLYQKFTAVRDYFKHDMPKTFSEFGTNIILGLVKGMLNAFGTLKTTMFSAAENMMGWFKEKLGIHSPSRVFAQFGEYTMQGLTLGLQRSEEAPVAQVQGLAQRLTQLGAGIALSAAALPALSFDMPPPIAPRTAGAAGMVVQGDTIQITIQATPGSDQHAIARAVAQALDQRDRQKAARLRSSLSDY